jgi:redox-sensitive bicupin YhaK (pirin superfamily)
MTLTLRPARERGHANHGWLDTWHSFSFADYFDPAQMGFRDLRVINDDTIGAAAGFPTHGHRDMEIVTYMVQGALAHKDSTGGEGVLKRGDVQAMSAGTGVRHSEFNPSPSEAARLLQIWILPKEDGLEPAYRQKTFADETKENTLRLLVSEDGRAGSLAINQDVAVFASLLDEGKTVTHSLRPKHGAWIQVVEGAIQVNGQVLRSGDGAAIEAEPKIEIAAQERSEFLLFDLA